MLKAPDVQLSLYTRPDYCKSQQQAFDSGRIKHIMKPYQYYTVTNRFLKNHHA